MQWHERVKDVFQTAVDILNNSVVIVNNPQQAKEIARMVDAFKPVGAVVKYADREDSIYENGEFQESTFKVAVYEDLAI